MNHARAEAERSTRNAVGGDVNAHQLSGLSFFFTGIVSTNFVETVLGRLAVIEWQRSIKSDGSSGIFGKWLEQGVLLHFWLMVIGRFMGELCGQCW